MAARKKSYIYVEAREVDYGYPDGQKDVSFAHVYLWADNDVEAYDEGDRLMEVDRMSAKGDNVTHFKGKFLNNYVIEVPAMAMGLLVR